MRGTAIRTGRKPKIAKQGQRPSLGLKVTSEIKNKLDAAAKATGRTQSQEAERRLEQSFVNEAAFPDIMALIYGRQTAGLMLELGDLMSEVGHGIGFRATGTLAGAEDWLSHPLAYDEAVKAVVAFLEALRPAGEIVQLRRSIAPKERPDLQQVLDVHRNPGTATAGGHAALLTGDMEIGGVAGEKIAMKQLLLGDLIERLRPNRAGEPG